jgi:hypothetical protein
MLRRGGQEDTNSNLGIAISVEMGDTYATAIAKYVFFYGYIGETWKNIARAAREASRMR